MLLILSSPRNFSGQSVESCNLGLRGAGGQAVYGGWDLREGTDVGKDSG
jgi:hypothetical protein